MSPFALLVSASEAAYSSNVHNLPTHTYKFLLTSLRKKAPAEVSSPLTLCPRSESALTIGV